MRLYVDQGNTRVKWRLLDASDLVVSGVAASLDFSQLKKSILPYRPLIRDIWVASVLDSHWRHQFANELANEYGVSANFVQVKASLFDVKPAYNDLSKLGVDRWLSLLAAYKVCQQVCVVVSAGSAVTVDFVDNAGQHLGGLIFPGMALMREAMQQKSQSLKSPQANIASSWAPGRTTLECIEAGLSAGFAGFAQQIEEYACTSLVNPEVFVTGGDASSFAAHLRTPHKIYDGLVFEGLYLVSSL